MNSHNTCVYGERETIIPEWWPKRPLVHMKWTSLNSSCVDEIGISSSFSFFLCSSFWYIDQSHNQWWYLNDGFLSLLGFNTNIIHFKFSVSGFQYISSRTLQRSCVKAKAPCFEIRFYAHFSTFCLHVHKISWTKSVSNKLKYYSRKTSVYF